MNQQQPQELTTKVNVYWNKKRKDAAGGSAILSIILILIYALTARFIGLVGLIIFLLLLALFGASVFWRKNPHYTEQEKAPSQAQDDKPLFIRLQEQEELGKQLKQASQLPVVTSSSVAQLQQVGSATKDVPSPKIPQEQVRQQDEQRHQVETREQLLQSISLGFLPEQKREENFPAASESAVKGKLQKREEEYLSQLQEVLTDLQETDPEKRKLIQEKLSKKIEETEKKREEAERKLEQAEARLKIEMIDQNDDKEAAKPHAFIKESEEMIYCIHCGTQLPTIASFCLKCGKPVSGTATTDAVPQATQATQVESCEIICKGGGILGGKSFFVARALGAKGVFIAATSTKIFRSNVGGSDGSGNDWHRPDTYSWGSKPLAEAAFDEIVSMLSQEGWQSTSTGPEWWQCKFKRQVILGNTPSKSPTFSKEVNEKARNLFAKAGERFFAERWQEAITILDQLIPLSPKEAFWTYNGYVMRGDAYNELKQYQKALADYNCAIELAPKSAVAHCSRGRAYQGLGQNQRALADYDRAIELDPELDDAYKSRAFFYYDELKQYQKALADANRAIELVPKSALYYTLRGMIYRDLGQNQKALADYDRAIELDPELTNVKALRQITYEELNNN